MTKKTENALDRFEAAAREEWSRELVVERKEDALILRMSDEYKRELAGLVPRAAPSTSVEVEK